MDLQSDLTHVTQSNKRKRKHNNGEYNSECHQPSKRANLRADNEFLQPASNRPISETTSSVHSTTTCSLIENPSQHGYTTATTTVALAQAPDQQSQTTCSTTLKMHMHVERPSVGASQTTIAADDGNNRRLRSKPPKSPSATKSRDKMRGKERTTEDSQLEGNAGGGTAAVQHTNDYAKVNKSIDKPAKVQKCPAKLPVKSFGQNRNKPADLRFCPLPALAWADAADVWRLMCRKDEKALLDRDPGMLARHPGIQSRMRAILLDWLMEVCEVYKLHRETYYLAVDYLDRYLTANLKLPKTRLQLIGITCLFTAAKVEEIYPPKIAEFAYVTDGACTEDDIVKQELMLMLGLNWSINPVTIIGWLSVYMQVNSSNRTPPSVNQLVSADAALKESAAFVYPQFSAYEFVLATRVLDLCTLDVDIANFQYSVVAAAVLVHTINRTTALRVSGLDWQIIKPCFTWMEPFYDVIRAESVNMFLTETDEQVQPSYGLGHLSSQINTDDTYVIQTHSTSLALFEQALKSRETKMAKTIKHKTMLLSESLKKQQSTPSAPNGENGLLDAGGPLTPPDSNRKSNIGSTNTLSVANAENAGCTKPDFVSGSASNTVSATSICGPTSSLSNN